MVFVDRVAPSRSRLAAVFAAVVGASCALAPCRAFAAPPPRVASPADKEAARTFAEKGFEQYQAGDCPAARKSFEQAESHVHAPPHRLFIARCDAKLGQLLAARSIYQEIVAEKLAADAAPPFREAQISAKGELDEIEIRLPTLELALTAHVAGASIAIDGRPLAASEIGKPKQVDPGQHAIVATAPGRPELRRSVTTRDGGGNARVEFDLGPAAAASPVESSRLPAIVAFSVGGAGILVGSITGVVSLNKVSALDKACPNKHCADPSLRSEADGAKTAGTISTIAFVVGGLGVATGAALLVIKPTFGGAPAKQGSGDHDVRIGLGFGSISASGRF